MHAQKIGRIVSSVVQRASGVCLLLGLLALLACNNSNGSGASPPSGSLTPTPNQGTTPTAQSDVQIAAIEVFPTQPQAGQRFTLNVYITNAGTAPSGAYDLALFLQDVSRRATYPIGTFRQDGVQPGERSVVYSSHQLLVNCPGAYQVHVEIHPLLSQDAHPDHDTVIWPFTVGGALTSGC